MTATSNISTIPVPHAVNDAGSVAQILLHAARHHPTSGTTYLQRTGDGPTVRVHRSYPQLLDEALSLTGALRDRGLRPQSKVALLLDDHEDFVTVLWACFLGGFVPCPMVAQPTDPTRWASALRHVDELLERPLVVTSQSIDDTMPAVPGLATVTVESLRTGEHEPTPYLASAHDLALLVLTSGSTGNAKAVTLTHGNLLSSMAAKAAVQQLNPDDITFNWISFDHVAALLETHLLPLYCGARQIHAPSEVVADDPMEFLRIVSRHRVTMTFTPNFLLGQLNTLFEPDVDGARLDLSCLRHIVSGGEANVVATGTRFLDTFAAYGLRETALWPAFGMTETCAGSIYNRDFPRADTGQEFAAVGHPVPGLQLRVADQDGRPLPAGAAGEVQLRGPMVTRGYFNNDEATRAAFTADGWFRTGDLGRLADGRLTLVGRSKDSIIVNGVNYFSHEIETAVEELDGIARGYVAAFPTRRPGSDTEQLVIALHAETADEADLHRLLTAVRSTVVLLCGFRPGFILPLSKADFPKTSLGKTLRPRMRQQLESGGYDRVIADTAALTTRQLGGYSAPQGGTESILTDVYAELFDVPATEISATASFFDLGGTSLDILRLQQQIARRFGVSDLPIIAILTAPSVRELAAVVDEGGGGPRRYDPIVGLQTSGTKTPLFCVHPGVGEVLVFVNLAKYFVGDRPFYALRARGFNKGEEPFHTFDEMVDVYTSAIRRRQPHGPYALAGYSFGAAVAFEIAKRLEADGERVDFLGSFNLPPHIKYRMDELDFTETATNLAMFLDLVTKRQAVELPAELRALSKGNQLARLIELAPPDRVAELDLDLTKFTAWAELADGLTGLGRTYTPSGAVRSMSVFCAVPLRGTKQDWIDNELRRWDEFTTEANRYIDVPGEHYTLMGPRHVTAFQSILRKELDRALAQADADR
ncbi:non-ribosomal peptide synthetase [Nocardia sp. GTS18]|uniref:non-ribosomal peptide synthetase n=1 Tax=Nocardia sp. GTS18 TaxID=1778064 RepID=UPI0015EF365E|nr:non-ribosomal peptide synthetase [Nocardia sp. GTS18]